jgi:hypothetical protein
MPKSLPEFRNAHTGQPCDGRVLPAFSGSPFAFTVDDAVINGGLVRGYLSSEYIFEIPQKARATEIPGM